jgi:hypothetical protein
MEPDNMDEWFDEWDEGRETDLGLEAVVLLDLSTSMQGAEIKLASEAMWVLKRGLDEIDAKVTVLGFHSFTVGLFDRNKTVGREVPHWSELRAATQPAHALRVARTILSVSEMPNKFLAVITDGGWHTGDNGVLGDGSPSGPWNGPQADYPALLDAIPAFKMYVGVGSGGAMNNEEAQQHFHVRASVGDPMGVVPLVERTVNQMIQARLRGR